MNNKYSKEDGVVLFNEECGICNFEINHYKKRSKLKFQADDIDLRPVH